MLAGQGPRTLEKTLGDHGKELGPIRRPVLIQQGVFVPFRPADQPPVLGLGHLVPGRFLAGLLQRRRAVDRTVESVEVMGELVQDQVVPAGLVAAGLQHVGPGEDDGAVIPGLAQQPHRRPRLPAELTRVQIDARIENDRLQPVEKIGLFESQDQQRSLPADGDLHLCR